MLEPDELNTSIVWSADCGPEPCQKDLPNGFAYGVDSACEPENGKSGGTKLKSTWFDFEKDSLLQPSQLLLLLEMEKKEDKQGIDADVPTTGAESLVERKDEI